MGEAGWPCEGGEAGSRRKFSGIALAKGGHVKIPEYFPFGLRRM